MKADFVHGQTFRIFQTERIARERKSADYSQLAQQSSVSAAAIFGAALVIGAAIAPVWAQPYPSKPIRYVVPFPPGGTIDIVGRIMGQKLAERFGQPVVIDNHPGAGGNVGYEFVAKARPDGYTIVINSAGLAISPSLYKKLNFDPIRDFAPVSLVAQIPIMVVVRPSLPVRSLKELVDYAKGNPGRLSFGTGGVGTGPHLAGELFKTLAKIDIVHVPYKGAGPAMMSMIGGEIDMMLIVVPAALPQIQTGKVRAIAVLGNERFASLPNVPTAKEAGTENWEVAVWYGVLAPAGTPRDIINRLNSEWARIAVLPDTVEKMQAAEVEPISTTPEQFAAFLKAETVRWGKVIREANLSISD
jgi:tripartite-type tricarboxylate transporter receptor subunit TctC